MYRGPAAKRAGSTSHECLLLFCKNILTLPVDSNIFHTKPQGGWCINQPSWLHSFHPFIHPTPQMIRCRSPPTPGRAGQHLRAIRPGRLVKKMIPGCTLDLPGRARSSWYYCFRRREDGNPTHATSVIVSDFLVPRWGPPGFWSPPAMSQKVLVAATRCPIMAPTLKTSTCSFGSSRSIACTEAQSLTPIG